MNVIGIVLAVALFALYASLPVFFGTLAGAVIGGVLSLGRSKPMIIGGICGGMVALAVFIWVLFL